MKGKFAGLVICFMLLCTSVLTGCSLVESNYDRFYNQVVATVENTKTGRKEEISKRDLMQGYQSYGYNYVQYYNYSQKDALNMTLELLENRKITIITAEEDETLSIGKNGEKLSVREKTYLYQQTIDALNNNLKSYYDEIVGNKEDDTKSDNITFNGYSKNATVTSPKEGEYYVERLNKSEDLLEGFSYTVARDFKDEDDYNLIYENLVNSLSNKNYKKAFSRYYRDLKLSEYGMKLQSSAKAVFEREINRLYKVIYENYVVSKYSQSNKNLDSISSVSASQITDLYTSKVRASYTQYVTEEDSNYDKNVQSSLNETYYFKTDSDSTKFFTVANILFKFNDEQQALYNSLKSKYEANDGGYTYQDYQSDLDRLYGSIEPVVRQLNSETNEYEVIESDLTVENVYTSLKDDLLSAKSQSVNKVGDTINEYIYLYNEDTGMFNATNNYVIGIDKDGNAVSNFVESFNNAGIELYDNGRAEIGDITGYVRSEYGIHVLVYTGACKNLFDGVDGSFELDDSAIDTLYKTRVNVLVDKTYFDVLYDEIYADNYSYFENANLNILRKDYTITQYSNRYSDLLN